VGLENFFWTCAVFGILIVAEGRRFKKQCPQNASVTFGSGLRKVRNGLTTRFGHAMQERFQTLCHKVLQLASITPLPMGRFKRM